MTDDGLKALGGLNSLKKLYLAETAATAAGFSTFSEPHSLTLLNLSGCPVTAEGINELKRFAYAGVIVSGRRPVRRRAVGPTHGRDHTIQHATCGAVPVGNSADGLGD